MPADVSGYIANVYVSVNLNSQIQDHTRMEISARKVSKHRFVYKHQLDFKVANYWPGSGLALTYWQQIDISVGL